MWLANFPFCYTYLVRWRSKASALNVILCEWVPVTAALAIHYSANVWLTVLMLFGNFLLYECGYLGNDLADDSADPRGRYHEAHRINLPIFLLSRLAIVALILSILWVTRGASFTLTYLALALLLLAGFFWHSSRKPRRLHFLRIFTFMLLQLYKFAPVVFPQVPMSDGAWLVIAIFFCWGGWRMIAYIMMKYGGEKTVQGQDFDPLRLLHPMSLVICAPLMLIGPSGSIWNAPATIWIIYLGIAVLRTSFQLSQWKLVWK